MLLAAGIIMCVVSFGFWIKELIQKQKEKKHPPKERKPLSFRRYPPYDGLQ